MLQHETIPQPIPLVRQDTSAGCASEAVATSTEANAGEDNAGEQAQSVFDAPMTPQEFARAIALMEARREVRRRPKPDAPDTRTLLTDGAGNVFTVDASVEEIRAEVQAHRVIKHRDVAMTSRKRKELSWWLLLGGFLLSSAVAVGLTLLMYVFVRKYNTVLTLYMKQEQKLANLEQAQQDSSGLRPLSQVADNTPVYARYTDLIALANGASADQIFVANTQGNALAGTPQWMLLGWHGKYVVRGWQWPEGYTVKYKNLQGIFTSTNNQSGLQEMADVPLQYFQSKVVLPGVADSSTGIGEEVHLPGMP